MKQKSYDPWEKYEQKKLKNEFLAKNSNSVDVKNEAKQFHGNENGNFAVKSRVQGVFRNVKERAQIGVNLRCTFL